MKNSICCRYLGVLVVVGSIRGRYFLGEIVVWIGSIGLWASIRFWGFEGVGSDIVLWCFLCRYLGFLGRVVGIVGAFVLVLFFVLRIIRGHSFGLVGFDFNFNFSCCLGNIICFEYLDCFGLIGLQGSCAGWFGNDGWVFCGLFLLSIGRGRGSLFCREYVEGIRKRLHLIFFHLHPKLFRNLSILGWKSGIFFCSWNLKGFFGWIVVWRVLLLVERGRLLRFCRSSFCGRGLRWLRSRCCLPCGSFLIKEKAVCRMFACEGIFGTRCQFLFGGLRVLLGFCVGCLI